MTAYNGLHNVRILFKTMIDKSDKSPQTKMMKEKSFFKEFPSPEKTKENRMTVGTVRILNPPRM
jgi:hypothetical protein